MFEENDFYICNIKCRPPSNRVPTDDEAKAVCRGSGSNVAGTAADNSVSWCDGVKAYRGQRREDHQARVDRTEGPDHAYVPSAALLRDPSKKPMFEDMKKSVEA